MVFARNEVEGEWMWREHKPPRVCSYSNLGIYFVCNETWDTRVNKVIDSGRKRLNQLQSVISKSINLGACKMLLLSVVRPGLEYGL